ncbi:STAS domain-containing protein [Bacillus subtilis]|uniref:STAS domain-containing protein n=1 Tax=Bacillus subtilis TaxID=1423 RepID=UPI0004A5888B|nr:STAS domain-containing protein [Bacillus subtilis]CCU57720.1 hypothetical protein BSUBE1_1089 [Bacillus subtilis E1]
MSKIKVKTVKIVVPPKVENDVDGFIFFARIFKNLKDEFSKRIVFDFSNVSWFEANLVAIFASIIEDLRKRSCSVSFLKVSPSIREVFKKNGFYDYYNLGKEDDTFDSTIPFRIFRVDDEEGFTEYLNEEVIPKIQLPLNDKQIRLFKKCLQEVFENANMHAGSEHVLTCGQYYHKNRKVAFTIVDIGETIGKNVRKKIPEIIDCDAIEWATEFGNTTKIAKDGGIGLDFLKKYLQKNGVLQIISGQGYWEQTRGRIFKRNTPHMFGGTIVNLISDLSGDIGGIGKIVF